MSEKKELYRDADQARIAGVCAGIAEYFGIEVWLVRILTVTCFFLLAGPFVIVSYIAAWFILDKRPGTSTKTKGSVNVASPTRSHKGKGWQNSSEKVERVEIKSRVWQAGEPPRQAYYDIRKQFRAVEERLRKIETYVTSKEFQLNREISKL